MARREHLSILLDTLEAIARAAEADEDNLVRLAARANLPYDRLRTVVAELQEKRLVASGRPLRPTRPGLELLAAASAWRSTLEAAGFLDAPIQSTGRVHGS